MSKSSDNNGGMGCLFWFIILMLVLRNCGQDDALKALEKKVEAQQEQRHKDLNF
jgi:hypothetical protein